MKEQPTERYLTVALRVAQEASQAVLEIRQRGNISQNRKEDRSLVTEADLKADQIIREGLAQHFPEHGILTEEDGLSGRTGSDWVWVIDPLDGTKAYAKGIAGFSVMIGLLHEGRPTLGIVVDPLEHRVYEAVRGSGAYVTEQGRKKRLRVSKRNQLPEMPLVTSTDCSEILLKKIRKRLGSPLIPPINSVGIKIGLIVSQVADIYLSHHPVHYWDSCAPQVILEEAGGCLTYLDGMPLLYSLEQGHEHQKLILASNGLRHKELVRSLDFILVGG